MPDTPASLLAVDAALLAPMPADDATRLLIFAIRRMAVGGIADAHAQHALLIRFGLGYRRPLVLLRALMLELSRAAARPIPVAPCCCPRLTAAEAALVSAARSAGDAAAGKAHQLLGGVLGTPDCLGAVVTLAAVAEAFADGGQPLG